jgi:hypothetical protein
MPMGTASKRDASSACKMPRAERTLTSCSPDWPPKMMPTRKRR